MMKSAINRDATILRILIQHAPIIDLQNYDGKTALALAVDEGFGRISSSAVGR